MCLDLELLERTDTLANLEGEGQRVETTDIVGSEYEEWFKGFGDLFLQEGGRIGGW